MADAAPDRPAIAIDRLTKRYGRLTAVRELSLTVERGEIFGFLGLNGAGKTTTIRILLDLIRPSAGRATVLGFDCQTQGLDVRARVGYLPGEPGFYEDMTGETVLGLLADLSGERVRHEDRDRLLDRFAFARADLGRRLREYSTGMKRKLALVQAFQADPPLLILDEPTEGLDPLMQEACYDLLAEVKRRGRTVFMSSHVLSEVERVCDRIALVRQGKLVLVKPVAELRRLPARRVRVTFREDVRTDAARRLPAEYQRVELSPRAWTLDATGALGPLVQALAGLPVADLEVQAPHLEDVLVRYYREGEAS
jgi:ABC-2 type transport system ATP-binding protein